MQRTCDWELDHTDYFPGGATPKALSARTDTPPLAASGTAVPPTLASGNYANALTAISPVYTNILLHAVERDYLNGDSAKLVDRIIWLKGWLDAAAPATRAAATISDQQQYMAQQARLYALLRQFSLNLDYFGQYRNHVSLLSIKIYTASIRDLLTYGRQIEQSYLAYQAALAAQQNDQASLDKIRAAALANVAALQGQLNQDVAQHQLLEANIKQILGELASLWVQLFDAEAAFKDAVAKAGQGCDFTQIVAIGAAVASVVVTGGAAAPAIGLALTALKGMQEKDGKKVPIPDNFTGFKYEVSTVVTAGQDIASFVSAFDKVRDQITPKSGASGVPALPDDEAKIVARADDIDRQLQPFLKLPEAKSYQQLLHTFVATAQARNNKLLELQALYNSWDATTAQINLTQAEAAGIATSIANLQDPRLMPALLFMEGAYRQSQADIVRNLYELGRACEYYSLVEVSMPINDFAVAALESTFSGLIAQYNQARAAFGAGPYRFSDEMVPLGDIVTKKDMERFRMAGQITFAVPDAHPSFDHMHHVLATRVWVELRKKKAKVVAYACDLTHHGRSVQFDGTRKRHVFSHVPVTIPYERRADGHEITTGAIVDLNDPNREYEGLSPYGPWTLSVRGVSAAELAAVDQIVLHFDGSGRS